MTNSSYGNAAKTCSSTTADRMVEDLQRKYGRRFYRLARSRGLSDVDAADVVQTSLISMRQRLIDKGPPGDNVTYFCRVVLNQVTQFYRDKKNAKEQLPDDPDDFDPVEPEPQRVVAPWSLEKRLMLKAANLAVEQLSQHLRDVYELAVIAELSPAEIAKLLGKEPGTVRVYLSMARRQVRERADELLAELEQQRAQKYNGEKRS